MLTTLRIKNLALVTDLTLELHPGYIAISGETGAGKSIILGALNLVLGERADRSLIRSGSDSCTVEAVFDVSSIDTTLRSILEENGLEPCENAHLFLKRSFTSGGANRQFINGSPTTLQKLSAVGRLLVDIHGPHDHQSLLYPSRQLAILDAYGKIESERAEFANLARRKTELEKDKANLIVDERTYAQQLDLLRFQVHEINNASVDPNEEDTLQADHQRAANTSKIMDLTRDASTIIADEETGLLTQSGRLGRLLSELQTLDPGVKSLLDLHAECVTLQNELRTQISQYADSLETDPEQHQMLEERLNLIHSLKRKYGQTLRDVISFGEEAAEKLHNLEQRDTELSRINAKIEKTSAHLNQLGRDLSIKRRKVIPKMARAIAGELSQLGFEHSQFDVSIKSTENASDGNSQFELSGFDSIEFQFAPNKGEPIRPLRAIASSGEMARVMLALKTVLANQDEVPVLLFDEVDANVGGVTATVVGRKMLQIASTRQVLCITHLAPVAAAAEFHYVVTKQIRSGRTHSDIHVLTGGDRIAELARMLGGTSKEALKHAATLLDEKAHE